MKPISKTAFYCCGVRMQDAASVSPVCGDIYAKDFMNEEGLRVFEDFKNEANPNASNVARHRIIDDFLRRELLANPDLTIVLIGAGFDSRAFRLKGGAWLEFDEPQVIGYKNERLPAEGCENELQRIAIDFSTESLKEKLSPFSNRSPIVFVVEGVFGYLDEDEIRRMLETLHRLFPRHKLVGDLTSKAFIEKYRGAVHDKIASMGATFKFAADRPEKIFLENGYNLTEKISIVESAIDYGSIKLPKILLKTMFRTLASGYAVYLFEIS
ncbi:MAG TPA: SAM-dependent methyltransferase [Pyrinomonadaceae bacterium]|jgi:methyltransferase (TIGR00027 family)